MNRLVSWIYVMLVFGVVSFGWAGPLSERDEIRRTILQARHLGAHGLGYNNQSQAELAKKLSPASIPILFELLVQDKEAHSGVVAGLASQCGAAIEPILGVAEQRAVPFMNLSDLRDALAWMKHAETCQAVDQRLAGEAIVRLDHIIQAESARRRQVAEERKVRQARLTERGLRMLDPEGRKSVSINECLEVVWESVKAAGIDPTKSEASQQMLNRQIAMCYDSRSLVNN
jgi:hypothetical protein